jgi:hypothetical protein
MIVNFGRAVYYKFESVTHDKKPLASNADNFFVFRPSYDNYILKHTQFPQLKAKMYWMHDKEAKGHPNSTF